jgi:TPP-dependent pyruvate/acetoin dehydrogenase alpha subunit
MFGFVHLYSGQEAVSSGIIRALRPDDYVCSTYRDHVHALSKGVPAREVGLLLCCAVLCWVMGRLVGWNQNERPPGCAQLSSVALDRRQHAADSVAGALSMPLPDHRHETPPNPTQIMAELFGKKTGCCRGQGGSMHMFSAKHGVLGGYAFIGEGIPIGLGAAFQSAYK